MGFASVGGGITNHADLTGLSADDHTQYVYTSPAASSRNLIICGGAAVRGLAIQAATGQTASELEIIGPTGTIKVSILDSAGIRIANNRSLQFSSTNDATATTDTVLSRYGAGQMLVGTDNANKHWLSRKGEDVVTGGLSASSTTLTAWTNTVVTLNLGRYLVEYWLHFDAAATGGWKWDLLGGNLVDADVNWLAHALTWIPGTGLVNNQRLTNLSDIIQNNTGGANGLLWIKGRLNVNKTGGGTFGVRGCQVTNTGGSLVGQNGSHFNITDCAN